MIALRKIEMIMHTDYIITLFSAKLYNYMLSIILGFMKVIGWANRRKAKFIFKSLNFSLFKNFHYVWFSLYLVLGTSHFIMFLAMICTFVL